MPARAIHLLSRVPRPTEPGCAAELDSVAVGHRAGIGRADEIRSAGPLFRRTIQAAPGRPGRRELELGSALERRRAATSMASHHRAHSVHEPSQLRMRWKPRSRAARTTQRRSLADPAVRDDVTVAADALGPVQGRELIGALRPPVLADLLVPRDRRRRPGCGRRAGAGLVMPGGAMTSPSTSAGARAIHQGERRSRRSAAGCRRGMPATRSRPRQSSWSPWAGMLVDSGRLFVERNPRRRLRAAGRRLRAGAPARVEAGGTSPSLLL